MKKRIQIVSNYCQNEYFSTFLHKLLNDRDRQRQIDVERIRKKETETEEYISHFVWQLVSGKWTCTNKVEDSFIPNISIHSFIRSHVHSFIHSIIQAVCIAPLLLIGAPDTWRILCRNISPKHYRQLWVKVLPKVPTWRIERESNLWPFGRKASTQPKRQHTPHGA